MNSYLARSATFIYTLLRFQREYRPVVLARNTRNVSEFPLENVVPLMPQSRLYRASARRLRPLPTGNYDRRLKRAARRFDCVLFHAHFGWAASTALDVGAQLGIPLVTTFYGNDLSPTFSEHYPYERLFAEGAFFICEGPAMQARLEELGCPRDKIRIVRIGLDLEQFEFRPREPTRPLIVVQTARFTAKKGLDISIQAYAASRSRLGPSELWLIGDGELRPELQSLVPRLGVSDSVRFFGMLTHSEYRDVISRAHICLQPSRTAPDGDTEGGAPTVLLEMQAAGIPIVATRHADIPWVVAEPEELVPEDDIDAVAEALMRLAKSSNEDWRRSAERGRALVEREHDACSTAAQVEAIYDQALALAGT